MDLVDVLGVLLGFFFLNVGVAAAFLRKFAKLAKESGELLVAIGKAGEDGNLSGDDLRNIIKEAKDIAEAVNVIRAETIANPKKK